MNRELRARATEFTTRDDGEAKVIEGYFAVFDSNYEIAPKMSESIKAGAFTGSMSNDVRALTNHDTTLVLGRVKAGTLELRQDEHGLWGKVTINPNDVDAMNLYERVKRGDVDQCSIGFEILSEVTDYREDGSIHWTIEDVNLWEVSCCTFPAYEETNISSRTAQKAEVEKRELLIWKKKMNEKLGGKNDAESTVTSEED